MCARRARAGGGQKRVKKQGSGRKFSPGPDEVKKRSKEGQKGVKGGQKEVWTPF